VETKALEVLPEVVDRLVREFDPDRIYLFGSYAWGEPDEDSDLDLLIVVDHLRETPHKERVRARLCLRDVGIPKDVLVQTEESVRRRARVAASLERMILDRGRLLYERRNAG
jgi:predicted nucleotidyltransferase